MKKALSTTSYQPEANKSKNSRDVECNPSVVLVLNGILFQYLELQCLDETYRTLHDECGALDLPIPADIPSEIESFPDSYQDVQKLFNSFDEENGDTLLEHWENIMPLMENENPQELKKLNVLLRIYIALIPHRKNHSIEEKNEAMKALKEFFESSSGDSLIDEEMLTYYALPYIPDIKRHSVLSNLLKDEWSSQLRARLDNALSKLYSKKNSLSPLESDLARLYFLWRNGKNHLMEDADGNDWTFRCVSTTENPPPSLSNQCEDDEHTNGKDNSVDIFFEAIAKLSNRNRRLLDSHRELQAKYSETTDLCCVLLNSLSRSCSGKEVDLEGLQKALECFPTIYKRFQENQTNHEVRNYDDLLSSTGDPDRHLFDVEDNNDKFSETKRQNARLKSHPHSTKRKAPLQSNRHEEPTISKSKPSNEIRHTARSESTRVLFKAEIRPRSRSAPSTSRTFICKKDGDDEDGSGNTTDTPSEELYFEGANTKTVINMNTYRVNTCRKPIHPVIE